MSEHRAQISWQNSGSDLVYESYSRSHQWAFPGGTTVAASAAVEFMGKENRVDPEEALVASLSSCHMLTFLAIAAKKRINVASYSDSAVGYLDKNAHGRLAINRVTLSPAVEFVRGTAPDEQQFKRMHQLAHAECFIANSVNTEVIVEPSMRISG